MKVLLRKNSTADYAEVKLDDRQDVQLNFTHDNLENPTAYVSECSYSLKLPRCAENDKFFSQFCQLDSVVLVNGYDPTRRMDYMLLDSTGAIISTGSAVINTIDGQNYNLSLLGSQSRIFKRLLNAGYDTAKAAEDSDYYLLQDWLKLRRQSFGAAGYRFVEGVNVINALMVYASWMVDSPLFNPFYYRGSLKTLYGLTGDSNITETNAFIASIVGFAPTAQGKYKDFDSATWMDAGYVNGEAAVQDVTFLPVLKRHRDLMGETTEEFEVDGEPTESQICEFRSYFQQPFIYISALWQMFQQEFEQITGGYSLNLDSRWFTAENQSLRRLIYMLPQTYKESTPIGTKTAMQNLSVTKSLPAYSASSKRWQDGVLFVNGLSAAGSATLTSTSVQLSAGERITFGYKISISLDILGGSPGSTIYFSNLNALSVRVSLVGSNIGTGNAKKRYMLLMSTDKFNREYFVKSGIWDNDMAGNISIEMKNDAEICTPAYTPFDGGMQTTIELFVTGDELSAVALEDTSVQLQVSVEFVKTQGQSPFGMTGDDGDLLWQWYNCPTSPKLKYDVTDITYAKSTNGRSNSQVSLETLFGSLNPFSVLMQFCKEHHLLWQVDDTAKTVKVVRSSDYYADRNAEGIGDITSSIDMSKKAVVSPLSWDSHSVQLNLADMETDYTDGYEKRVGVTYGSKRIITQNNISKAEKKLLCTGENDTVKASAMLGMTVAPVSSIMAATGRYFFVETPPMPLNIRGEEGANVYGNFYYRHNNSVWDSKILDGWRNVVYITDDLVKEIAYARYCWQGVDAIQWFSQYGYSVPCAVRPVFNTVSDGGLSVLFAPVREQYTQQPDEPSAYLYEHCWKNYIEEVYNAQNKTIELYINISPSMLTRLRRNPLVQIENCIYLLTEIKGWGEHSQKCKCKLRQITNINKLTQ